MATVRHREEGLPSRIQANQRCRSYPVASESSESSVPSSLFLSLPLPRPTFLTRSLTLILSLTGRWLAEGLSVSSVAPPPSSGLTFRTLSLGPPIGPPVERLLITFSIFLCAELGTFGSTLSVSCLTAPVGPP